MWKVTDRSNKPTMMQTAGKSDRTKDNYLFKLKLKTTYDM